MTGGQHNIAGGRILRALIVFVVFPCLARAERLPTKFYSMTDGLVSNRISRIVCDSRGYIWFCTEDGLSRFDGYVFTNYTTQQGLPVNYVDDLLETRDGSYWIATAEGLCRFNPASSVLSKGDPLFTVYRPGGDDASARVKALYEDRAGTLWCGTRRGVYRVDRHSGRVEFHNVDFGIRRDERGEQYVRGIVEDRAGVLWVSSKSGLSRRFPDGRTEGFTTENGLPSNDLMRLMVDDAGQIWVPAAGFVLRIAAELDANKSIVAERYGTKDGLPCADVDVVSETSDGRLWIGGDCGLSELLHAPGDQGRRIRVEISTSTLANASVWAVTEDLCGNLWIGTSNGAIRVARRGFTSYTEADGLPAGYVTSISQSQSGEVFADSSLAGQHVIVPFDGMRFTYFKPNLPKRLSRYDWGIGHSTFQDRSGEWWLPTSNGLIRYPKVERIEQLVRVRPKAVYGVADGLPSNDVFHLYEVRNGDLWLTIRHSVQAQVVRWERSTGRFRAYSEASGLPPSQSYYPNSFCEDRAGNLWIGYEGGGLARFSGERFTFFTTADGVARGDIRQVYCDSLGRVWFTSSRGGLGMVDDPTAIQPRFVSLTTTDGLSSDNISSIVEDGPNCFYVATFRGLDYLDLNTGQSRRFTTADGLISDRVIYILRDRQGTLWFIAEQGLSRLASSTGRSRPAPTAFITALRINGNDLSLSQLGETEIRRVEFAPGQDNVQIDFASPLVASGEAIRYQYKLEGANEDWGGSYDRTTSELRQPRAGSLSLPCSSSRLARHAERHAGVFRVPLARSDLSSVVVSGLSRACRRRRCLCAPSVSRRPDSQARTSAYSHSHGSARRHRLEPFADCHPQ